MVTRTIGRVQVTTEVHGPFVRHAFLPLDPPMGAQVSIVRVGDVLVDTGSTRVTEAVLEVLREDPPRRIVLTHQHEDHIGNVRPIREALGAIPVHAPRELVPAIVSLREVSAYRAAYWGHPHPVELDDLVPYDAEDVFSVGPVDLRALATPGHTPTHMALASRSDADDRTYVLTGDLYASRPLEAFYEAATDDAIRSYRSVAALDRDVVMIPTHGRVRGKGGETLREAADWLERESAAIEVLASELGTRDPIALARARYGEDPFLAFSAGEMGKSVFVRSIVAPVRALPASALRVPPA